MFVIFFFQAEDGIRDRNVTGVQTCALPIFGKPLVGSVHYRQYLCEYCRPLGQIFARPNALPPRSEERRVGKECRSRWSPDNYKKKKEIQNNRGQNTRIMRRRY